jgi:outer membrane protein assembly factor BamB
MQGQNISGQPARSARRSRVREWRVGAALTVLVITVPTAVGALTTGPAQAVLTSRATTTSRATSTLEASSDTPAIPDWSEYLNGPTHSSYSPTSTAITPTNIGNLTGVWNWRPPWKVGDPGSPGFYASPSVADGVVYIAARNGWMYALSESTRTVLWSQYLGVVTATTCGGSGPISTASVVPDPSTGKLTVYVNAPDGYFYAFDAATGGVVWRSVVGIPSTTVNDYFAWGAPLVANGKVYIGIASQCDHPLVMAGLLAFDQVSGTRLAWWRSMSGTRIGASIWSAPMALPDGTIITDAGNAPAKNQPLYADSIVRLDGSTLHLLDAWQIPVSQQTNNADFGASPTRFTADLAGTPTPMIGVCNKNGIYYGFRQSDLHDGPVWEYRMAGAYGGGFNGQCDAAAIWDGTHLIAGGGNTTIINGVTYDGSVQALDPTTGIPVWSTGLPGEIIGSPTEDGAGVVAAQVFYSSTKANGVYFLDASTGAVVGQISTPGTAYFAQPVWEGTDLLVAAASGIGLTDFEALTPPTLGSVDPTLLAVGTRVSLSLTGTGFEPGATITFSGPTSAPTVNAKAQNVSVTPTSATATVTLSKSAPTGSYTLTLTNPDHTSAHCTGCVAVIAAPKLASITPSSVTRGSVTPVTMTGTGFAPGLTFVGPNGVMFTQVQYVSPTSATAVLGVNLAAATGSDLRITVVNDLAAGAGRDSEALLTIS